MIWILCLPRAPWPRSDSVCPEKPGVDHCSVFRPESDGTFVCSQLSQHSCLACTVFAWVVLFHLLPLGSRLGERDSLARISPHRRRQFLGKYECPSSLSCLSIERQKEERGGRFHGLIHSGATGEWCTAMMGHHAVPLLAAAAGAFISTSPHDWQS